MKTSHVDAPKGDNPLASNSTMGTEPQRDSLGRLLAVGAASAGLSVGGMWLLNELAGGLRGPNTQTREFSRSLRATEDFSRVPTVEPSALSDITWDSSNKPVIRYEVAGVRTFAAEFQVIGNLKFSRAISLNGDLSDPTYNVYTVVDGREAYNQPVLLIEPRNDVIAIGGDTQARVHFVGEFAHGWRSRGGIWYGHSEAKAEGLTNNGERIIAVRYIKVLDAPDADSVAGPR